LSFNWLLDAVWPKIGEGTPITPSERNQTLFDDKEEINLPTDM
jgi:hypothetical protein